METREEKIEKYLNEPIKVGEWVEVRGLGSKDKVTSFGTTDVLAIHEDGSISIKEHSQLVNVKKEDWKKYTRHIGVNPFPEKLWNSSLRIVAFSLESICHKLGLDRRRKTTMTENGSDIDIPYVNWNPAIVDKNGNEVVYQRDFCWSLNDKQALLESIYNRIDIGKVVIRERPYSWVVKRLKEGKEAAFCEVVDGKQRLKTIFEFVLGEFPDMNGNYFDDLSEEAKSRFFNFHGVAYGELGENATDEDVKAVFLGVNFTGVQMSQEHIDFVKSIQLKS